MSTEDTFAASALVHPTPLFTVRFDVAETGILAADRVGAVRSMHRFTGGTFEGRAGSGIVLPGGGDKALRRAENWIEIDAHAMLLTDDGVNILISYLGLWRAEAGMIEAVLGARGHEHFVEAEHYLRTTARFEAGDTSYAWLNGVVAVGVGRKSEMGIEHSFFEIL